MARIKGREVQVEIAATFGSAKVISSITKAAPPVIGSTAHAMANGTIGYFESMVGMVTLEGQAVSVADTDTNDFEGADLITTGLPDHVSGNVIPVTAWSSFGTITNFEVTGGDGIESDNTTIHDVVNQVEYAGLNPQTLSFQSLLDLPNTAAMAALRLAARNQAFTIFRVTFKNGTRVVARAVPSLPGLSLARAETGTRSFTAAVKGIVLELPAVA
jgi:hypothetical protein